MEWSAVLISEQSPSHVMITTMQTGPLLFNVKQTIRWVWQFICILNCSELELSFGKYYVYSFILLYNIRKILFDYIILLQLVVLIVSHFLWLKYRIRLRLSYYFSKFLYLFAERMVSWKDCLPVNFSVWITDLTFKSGEQVYFQWGGEVRIKMPVYLC